MDNLLVKNGSLMKGETLTVLYVKNMVSASCEMILREVLEQLGLQNFKVGLGVVSLKENISLRKWQQLKKELLKSGFELINNKKTILVEKIKNVIIEMVYFADELPATKNSEYISRKLSYDYTYLANTFSRVTGKNIAHYIIALKIEKAKELLMFNELTEKEIAYKLHFSSLAHFSNQFKKVTGITPSFYKSLKAKGRIPFEKV